MTKKRRLQAILLSLAMVLSMLPMTAIGLTAQAAGNIHVCARDECTYTSDEICAAGLEHMAGETAGDSESKVNVCEDGERRAAAAEEIGQEQSGSPDKSVGQAGEENTSASGNGHAAVSDERGGNAYYDNAFMQSDNNPSSFAWSTLCASDAPESMSDAMDFQADVGIGSDSSAFQASLFDIASPNYDAVTPLAIIPAPAAISSIFPDAVFAQAIASQLGKAVTDTVTQNELNTIRSINVTGAMHNLEGAQYLRGLTGDARFDNCQLTERIPQAFITDIYPGVGYYIANNQRYEFPTISTAQNPLQAVYNQLFPLFRQIAANSNGAQIGTWNVYGAQNLSFPAVNGSELLNHSLTASGQYQIQLTLSYPAWMGLDNSIYIYRVDFSAATTGVINGTVSDQHGAPISGVTMSLLPGGTTTTTDVNGFYSFGALNPGNYSVTAAMSGYNTQTKAGVVVAGGTTVINFTMIASPGSLTGTVTSLFDGSPIAGASVELRAGTVVIGTTTTDSDGDYFFDAVPVGRYIAYASAPNYSTGHSFTELVGSNMTTTMVDVILAPLPVRLSGHVYSTVAGNPPIAGAVVTMPDGSSRTTDTSGYYAFESVNPGTYTLTASDSPAHSSEQKTITLNPGSDGTVDFYLSPNPIRVTVSVVDGSNGDAPLSGAILSGVGYIAITGADGSYTRYVAAGTYTVSGDKIGYFGDSGSDSVTFTVDEGDPERPVLIRLYQASLYGYVLEDGTNNPLTNAVVTVSSGGIAVTTANTNASGYYQVEDLLPDTYSVSASLSGYEPSAIATVVIDNDSHRQDFTLARSAALPPELSGSVLDLNSRLPIVGAAITVLGANGAVVASGATGAGGLYSFNTIPAGTYTVMASADGYQSVTRSGVVLRNGAVTRVPFYMINLMGTLSGTVSFTDGTLVPGVTIRVDGSAMTTVTDANGHYLFALPAAAHTVTEEADGQSKSATVIAGETAVVDFLLDIPPGVLRGTVACAETGVTIAGAQIVAFNLNDLSLQYTATTGNSGNYVFADVVPGTYSITASHPAYAAQTKAGDVRMAETTTVDFQLPGNPGLLEGTVTFKDTGAPVAGAAVMIGPDGILLTTDANGYYSIILVAGDYTAQIGYVGYAVQTKPATIVSNITTKVDFVLERIDGGDNQTPPPPSDAGGSSNVPQTGDYGNVLIWLVMLAGAVTGIACVLVWRSTGKCKCRLFRVKLRPDK